jgi:hypothetical protein
VRGEQCLNGRHHIWRCLHGEGSRCSSRDCLRGAAELLPCVASPPGRARDDLVIPQQFCGKRRRPAKLVVSSIGGMVGVGGSSRWMMPGRCEGESEEVAGRGSALGVKRNNPCLSSPDNEQLRQHLVRCLE